MHLKTKMTKTIFPDDPRRSFTEGQILQLIDGIPYIPRYVQEVVVSTYRRSRTSLPRKMAVDQQQGGIDRLVGELANGKFEDHIHLSICSDGLEGCKRPPAFYGHIASWFTYFFPFSSDFLLMLL